MKKKLRLKKEVKLILMALCLIVVVTILLQALEKKNYNDALERCNNNVVVKHTNSGDRYYICK